jgi:two-component system, OmpR family, sensor kinase
MTQPFSSLRSRLIALVVLFCLLMAAVFTAAVHWAYRGYSEEMRQRQAMVFAASVTGMYAEMLTLPLKARREVEERFAGLLLLDPSSAMYLIAPDGTVLAGYSKERSIGSASRIRTEPIRQLLDNPGGRTVMGDDPEFPGKLCLFAAAPMPAGGFLYVLLRMDQNDETDALAMTYANRTALLVALAGAVLSGFLVFGVMGLLTRPLRSLTAAADAVRESDLAADGANVESMPHITRNDEVGQLARAFSEMVRRLRTQLKRVRQMDANRREWMASISHDLRTPLTSLTGHLETVLLRSDRMPEAERQRFLETALANARQLDRLSASLFDFARLDSDEVRLEKAPAAIGELLDDIAARFATAAEQRQVTIESRWADGLPMVPVDAALLERALANLVENALRYTPPGGEVLLKAEAHDGGVALQVQDSGPGIAAQDLPHVFDRFYQGTHHREGRGHAGLGLAIVQRIVALHGGTVTAENRNGSQSGAVFTLRLPAA